MTKIICISDTHCQLEDIEIPDGDILVHAGDLTYRGTVSEMSKELFKLGKYPHKVKIFVAGNHDFLAQDNPTLVDEMCKSNGIIHLLDSHAIINGIKFYGSPRSPWFHNWAFNHHRGEDIKKYWNLIPDDTNVLITHGPPFGFLDETMEGDKVGCEMLLEAIERVKPKLMVCGHIHEGYGITNYGTINIVNASICTRQYKPTNKPIIFEYG